MATQEKPSTTLNATQVAETGKAYLFFFEDADMKTWIPKSTVLSKIPMEDGSFDVTIHNWILEKHDII